MNETVALVHPDDVNLADAKAAAAQHNASIVGSPFVPRGRVFLVDASATRLHQRPR